MPDPNLPCATRAVRSTAPRTTPDLRATAGLVVDGRDALRFARPVFVPVFAIIVTAALLGTACRTTAPADGPASAASPVAAVAADAAEAASARRPPRLRLVSLVLSRGVVGREPQGVGDAFAKGAGHVIAHATVANTGGTGTLTFRWLHEGNEAARETVHVGRNPRFRTWSHFATTTAAPGEYRVVLQAEAGEVLGESTFRLHD